MSNTMNRVLAVSSLTDVTSHKDDVKVVYTDTFSDMTIGQFVQTPTKEVDNILSTQEDFKTYVDYVVGLDRHNCIILLDRKELKVLYRDFSGDTHDDDYEEMFKCDSLAYLYNKLDCKLDNTMYEFVQKLNNEIKYGDL